MLDLSKEYELSDGREVKGLIELSQTCVMGFRYAGLVRYVTCHKEEVLWRSSFFKEDGTYSCDNKLKLVPVKQKVYYFIYELNSNPYPQISRVYKLKQSRKLKIKELERNYEDFKVLKLMEYEYD